MEIQARQGGLSRDEFWRSTIRGLFRAFVVMKGKSDEAVELATYQAYQTVRIGLMVKRKRSGKRETVTMPKWSEVIGKGSGTTLKAGDSKEKGLAFLNIVAARTGTKVRMGKKKG